MLKTQRAWYWTVQREASSLFSLSCPASIFSRQLHSFPAPGQQSADAANCQRAHEWASQKHHFIMTHFPIKTNQTIRPAIVNRNCKWNHNIRIVIPTLCSIVNLLEHIRRSRISIVRSGTTNSFLASGLFGEIALSCRHFKIVFNINRYEEKTLLIFKTRCREY